MSKLFCDICKQWHDQNVSCTTIPNQSNQKMEGKKLEISWQKDKGKFINLFVLIMFSMASFLCGGFYKGSSTTPVSDPNIDVLKQEIVSLQQQVQELTKELNNKNYQKYTENVNSLDQKMSSLQQLSQDISKKQDAIEKALNPNGTNIEEDMELSHIVDIVCAYTGAPKDQVLLSFGKLLHDNSNSVSNLDSNPVHSMDVVEEKDTVGSKDSINRKDKE